MPNVDFDRSILNNRMPQTLNSPDFKHRLLSVKAYLDYEDEHTVRVNFLDTLRPELWCIDGLARHLEPSPGRSYGLHLVESLPRIPVQFKSFPPDTNAWVLYVQVSPDQEPLDDAYFLKKVRDQIGFGSFHNINITLLPSKQHTLSIETPTDNEDESPSSRRGRFIAPIADVSAHWGWNGKQRRIVHQTWPGHSRILVHLRSRKTDLLERSASFSRTDSPRSWRRYHRLLRLYRHRPGIDFHSCLYCCRRIRGTTRTYSPGNRRYHADSGRPGLVFQSCYIHGW